MVSLPQHVRLVPRRDMRGGLRLTSAQAKWAVTRRIVLQKSQKAGYGQSKSSGCPDVPIVSRSRDTAMPPKTEFN